MSDKINDGGAAFPVPNDANVNDQEGMTLRDYFAAKAMHAMVTEPPWTQDGGTASVHHWSHGFKGVDPLDRFAFAAYRMADAMLKARQS